MVVSYLCSNIKFISFILLISLLFFVFLKFKTSVASSRAFLEYLVLTILPRNRDLSAENALLECLEMELTAPTSMR